MPNPTPNPKRTPDEEAQLFYKNLEETGQLRDVSENEDTSKLPARVTHVRYPDGTVKRIRFTSSGYH
jgi:allantoicase